MTNIQKLNSILLSDEACNQFHSTFNSDNDFHSWLTEILPEINACKNMQQNNPWHIYNVLDHILHSVECINKQSTTMSQNERYILALTMFLHDIGKPECHLTRKKNRVVIDSFFHHNEASAKISHRVLPSLQVNPHDATLIEALVLKHDIFMFIVDGKTNNPHHESLSKDILKREIKFFENKGLNGYDSMKKLIMVGRADNLAQNPAITKNSLLLLEKMDLILEDMAKTDERE